MEMSACLQNSTGILEAEIDGVTRGPRVGRLIRDGEQV